jgi:hypothetical protein
MAISISSRLSVQWLEPPWGAEPRFEFGSALQQASALPSEPRWIVVTLIGILSCLGEIDGRGFMFSTLIEA